MFWDVEKSEFVSDETETDFPLKKSRQIRSNNHVFVKLIVRWHDFYVSHTVEQKEELGQTLEIIKENIVNSTRINNFPKPIISLTDCLHSWQDQIEIYECIYCKNRANTYLGNLIFLIINF